MICLLKLFCYILTWSYFIKMLVLAFSETYKLDVFGNCCRKLKEVKKRLEDLTHIVAEYEVSFYVEVSLLLFL